MTAITFTPIPTDIVRALQAGGPDANDQPPEHAVSTGMGTPCRHCLQDVPEGAGMLIAAHRPFSAPQPYAEVGPIFLCADACPAWPGDGVPSILGTSDRYLLKGYTPDERILYGTGRIVDREDVADYAAELLARGAVAFVDVRSASNNCFLSRIRRG